jgi:hypothetical protein
MLQLGLCEARAIDTRPDQLNEALRRALSRLVELDAEFQAKLEQLDQSTAPLPEKARWVRELQEAFRDRREPCTQLVAELRSQLRSEKCALSEPDSAERMPTTTGLRRRRFASQGQGLASVLAVTSIIPDLCRRRLAGAC